jgi:HK97 family phage portal protein
MSWLQSFKSFGMKAAETWREMRHGGRVPFLSGLLRRTRFDYRKEVGDCLDSSVVTAPAMWIGRALPEAELKVKRKDAKGNETEADNHPMLALIQTPNPFYGDIALWMATIVSFVITGNAYWLIMRNSYGQPAELWFVPSWNIEPCWPQDGSEFIRHYHYRPGGSSGETFHIRPEDVVHFRHGINPRNLRMGLSPLEGVIREIFIDLESSNFVASLLRNMGVPGVVISPKAGAMPAPEDVQATKTWFAQAFGGDNRGGPLVMGAPTDVQAYGFNPQQMNMSEGRDVAEERVCACLGIPAAIVGFGAGLQSTKVGATMEELRKLAWNNGVLPIGRMLADELKRSLLSQFAGSQGLHVCWDTDDVPALQEDEDKRSDRAIKQFKEGLISHHQALRIVGEEPLATADFYLRPISVNEVPVAEVGIRIEPQSTLPLLMPPKGAKAQATDAAYKKGYVWALLLQRQSTGLQASAEKSLSRFFVGLGMRARHEAMPFLERDPTIAGKDAEKGEKSDELLAQLILDKLGIAQFQADLRHIYEAHYLEVAKATNAAAEHGGIGVNLSDTVTQAILAAGGKRVGLVDLEGQTRDALFQSLAQGRAEGEGPIKLAMRISDLVEAGPSTSPLLRARRIARTETAYAQNVATIERAREAGYGTLIIYDGLLGPGRSSEEHMARNGSIVSIEQALIMADEEHPNGTLSFAPNFEE